MEITNNNFFIFFAADYLEIQNGINFTGPIIFDNNTFGKDSFISFFEK